MSLNAFLHPRNPYRGEKRPDFDRLADDFPTLRTKIEQNGGKLDFSDRDAVRVLTLCLLKRDFDLDVEIPAGSLTPTLPLRFNYLLWIQDVAVEEDAEDVFGFDVGCGASCVFPLLAVKHFKWKMLATEKNAENFNVASRNVQRNSLQEQIRLFKASDEENVFAALEGRVNVNFTMCNPPFFDRDKASDSGFVHEVNVEGGEVEFVRRLIKDSERFGANVNVFTSMLGHKASVNKVKAELSAVAGIKSFCFTEFCQGRTMRWGVAWNWRLNERGLELASDLPTRRKRAEKKSHAPIRFSVNGSDIKAFCYVLVQWMREIHVDVKLFKVEDAFCSMTLKTFSRDWRHQRRKRRENLAPPQPKKSKNDDEEKAEKKVLQLCCKLTCQLGMDDDISVQVAFIDGEAGKDGLAQLVQYIKNKSKGV